MLYFTVDVKVCIDYLAVESLFMMEIASLRRLNADQSKGRSVERDRINTLESSVAHDE